MPPIDSAEPTRDAGNLAYWQLPADLWSRQEAVEACTRQVSVASTSRPTSINDATYLPSLEIAQKFTACVNAQEQANEAGRETLREKLVDRIVQELPAAIIGEAKKGNHNIPVIDLGSSHYGRFPFTPSQTRLFDYLRENNLHPKIATFGRAGSERKDYIMISF